MKRIRLTEEDLHRIVREAYKRAMKSLNEEGEAAGATNASQSGEFTTPFGPINRRAYATTAKRSHDFEEGTMTTQQADNEGTDEVNKRSKKKK